MPFSAPLPASKLSIDPDARKHLLGLRSIAVLEGAKGAMVLLSGSGLLLLVNRDVQNLAERLVSHLQLDPSSEYPHIFLQLAESASPGKLRLWAIGALLYALVRFIEARGLWYGRRWAEWFGVLTGLIYVPFEVVAFITRPRPGPVIALVVNLAIVGFLAMRLKKGQKKPHAPRL